MDYDKIIINLLNRIVTLEEKVAKLENTGTASQTNDTELPTGSKKYRDTLKWINNLNSCKIKFQPTGTIHNLFFITN